MLRFTPSLIAVAAASLLALPVLAGPDTSGARKAQPEAFSASLKLQKTYFESGFAGLALVSGANAYGSTQTVNCTVTAGCFVIVNANAQVAGIATVNPAAITIKVDGSAINSPYNTPVSTTSYTVMTYQTGMPIALGTHTVSTEVFVSSPTSLYQFNTEVKLYK